MVSEAPDSQAPLRRSFVDLDESDLEEAASLAMLRNLGWRGRTHWEDLLESRLILLLSEAQSGKTFECQAQQQKLWAMGEPAFYVELAQLDRQLWRDLRSPEEDARLEHWRRTQSARATVFLDSVDELRLTQGSFRNALRKVANDLAGGIGRARIILTSRPLKVDREYFLKTFEPPKSEIRATEEDFAILALGEVPKAANATAVADIRYVALAPLSNIDVTALARERGVEDLEAFLTALRTSSMAEFMHRPQDVIGAIAAWRALKGRFGTHAEQVAFDIQARLKPNPARDDRPLAPDTAYDGAKCLALGIVLSQRRTLLHDETDLDSDEAIAAIDPPLLLSDWSRDDVRALLERGLFGFASYGRVRFHNQLAVEFLAAARLHDLLEHGTSRRTIRRLLVVQTAQGFETIRPSLNEIAAWLALRQDWVFDLLLELDPSILLNLGDPGSLQLPQRERALAAYVARYGKGGWRGLNVPFVQVHRIADPGLGAIVRAEFPGVENPEVRRLLFLLIREARLADCADLARAAVYDLTLDLHERMTATDALLALGNPVLTEIAAGLVARSGGWEDAFVRYAAIQLFPAWLGVDQLCAILAWLPETRSIGRELARHLPALVYDLEPLARRALLAGIIPLVVEGLAFNRNIHAAQNARPHLVPMLARLCKVEIAAGGAAESLAEPIVLVRQLAGGMREDAETPADLAPEIANAGAGLRAAIFDREVSTVRRLMPDKPRLDAFFEIVWRGALRFQATDEPWIRDRLSTAWDADTRAAALDVAIFVFGNASENRADFLDTLKPSVVDDAELLAYVEKHQLPAEHSRDMRRMELANERRKRQAARSKAKARASWVSFWRELKDGGENAFSADRVSNTAWSLWQVMNRTDRNDSGSGWNRALLEAHFGVSVADRLRAALLPVWRGERPPVSSERAVDDNLYYTRWTFALAALAAEAEDPNWASKLSPDEADIAARYATLNMNGLPAWFDALAVAHEEIAERVIGGELSAELDRPATFQMWSMSLQNISHASPAVAAIFQPRLRAWLQATGGVPRPQDEDAGAAMRLESVLQVLVKFGTQDDRKAVRDRAIAVLRDGTNDPATRVWLPFLFNLDPKAAVERFEALCADVVVAPDSAGVAWISELFGHRPRGPGVNLRTEGMTGALLLRLVRLAYVHVRLDQDRHHEGSYTPDMRDEAQTGRAAFLNAILELGGEDGWQTKLTLAKDPALAHLRDRVHALAVDRAALDAEGPAMAVPDIAAFGAARDPGPRSSAEMFALLHDRLDDLEDELKRDTSPAEIWRDIETEKLMRRAISGVLETGARKAYTIVQEGVTAEEKETDIRLRSTSSPQEGVIELKIGDKPGYSGASLRSVVADQLVAKYLAPEDRRAGILLITRAKRDNWQHPDTGKTLDFEGLIDLLRDEAKRVRESFPGALFIDVRGVDLVPRLPTERAAANNRRVS